MLIDKRRKANFIAAQYGIAGQHSAVQICSWTKLALHGRGVCYKQKFYGIDCYRCCQMSPAFALCQQSCVHCWRPAEWMKKAKLAAREADDPELIIKGIVKQRRMLISGIGGAADVDRSRFLTTLNEFPSHWAISLSGEPTIYPKLAELIRSLKAHKEVRSIFLVTNGQEQSAISKLVAQCALPTQLYVSISAPDEKAYRQLNKPIYRDGWKRLMKTLCMLKQISRKGCRTVIRLTLMRGINDSSCAAASFAKIFEKAQPDFIEVKSYMFLGLSRKRLKKENMPLHADVKAFCKLLAKNLPSYKWEDEDKRSRVVLFKRKDSRFGKKIKWC